MLHVDIFVAVMLLDFLLFTSKKPKTPAFMRTVKRLWFYILQHKQS